MKHKISMITALFVLLQAVIACSAFPQKSPTATPTVEQPTAPVPTQTAPVQPSPEVTPTVEAPTTEAMTATPTEAPSETAAPWPTSARFPAAAPQLPAGTRIQLDEIHMVSQTEGWGISGRILLKTADGGKTWHEVTPSAATADLIYGTFLNNQTAWIIFSNGGQVDNPLPIYNTTDGGLTWTTNQGAPISPNVAGDTTWAVFAALDAQNVWLMVRGVYVGAGTHFSHELFHTTDGGVTWTSQDGEISDDYTGMVFADPTFGVRTLQTTGFYGPGAPTYDVTTDGGVTWTSRELPPPSGSADLFNQYPYCESFQPILLSSQSIRMLMACFDSYSPPKQFTSYLYSSQDGGMTWTTFPLPKKVLASQDTLFYFDAMHALMLGRDIYKSADGGQTWTYIQTVSWDAQLSFVDPLHGWATGGPVGDKALVYTIDGGKKWTLIKPVTGN